MYTINFSSTNCKLITVKFSCTCADHMTCTATVTLRDIQHYWIEQLSRNGTDRFTTYSVHQCPHCPSLSIVTDVCWSTVGESEGLAALNYSAVIIDCFNISSAELCRINCGGVWHAYHMLIILFTVFMCMLDLCRMGDCILVPFAPGHEARTTATYGDVGTCSLIFARAGIA